MSESEPNPQAVPEPQMDQCLQPRRLQQILVPLRLGQLQLRVQPSRQKLRRRPRRPRMPRRPLQLRVVRVALYRLFRASLPQPRRYLRLQLGPRRFPACQLACQPQQLLPRLACPQWLRVRWLRNRV